MKKLLSIIGSVMLACTLSAATWTLDGGALRTNLVDGGALVRSITITCGNVGNGASIATWWLYNAYRTNTTTRTMAGGYRDITYSYGGYTNYTSFATNYVQIRTNYFGGIFTNMITNVAMMTVTNLLAGATNTYDIVAQGTIQSNTVSTVTFSTPYFAFRGLYLTNTLGWTNSTITIVYDPVL